MTAQPIPNKENSKYVLETKDLGIYYGNFRAVTSVNIPIRRHMITAIIGPSGCGKSTLLRAFNRMNELFTGTRIEGKVLFVFPHFDDCAFVSSGFLQKITEKSKLNPHVAIFYEHEDEKAKNEAQVRLDVPRNKLYRALVKEYFATQKAK